MTELLRAAIWIKPIGAVRDRLRVAANHARAQLGGPEFDPHLTLLSGIELPPAQAVARLKQLAARIKPFIITLTDFGWTGERYRSLFLRADLTPELKDARRAAQEVFSLSPEKNFDPHISLVYGAEDAAAKTRIARELAAASLADLAFTAESLHLVNAASGVAVRDWGTLAESTLRPESSAE